MKDRILILISLLVSAVSLGYAAWIHQNANRAAENALRKRELEIVKAWAPKFQAIHLAMTESPMASDYDPKTIEELLQPLAEIVAKFGEPHPPEAPAPLFKIPNEVPR
jgi:hypothetical protein